MKAKKTGSLKKLNKLCPTHLVSQVFFLHTSNILPFPNQPTNQPTQTSDPSFCFIHLQQVSHESSQIRGEETRQVQQRHQQPRCRGWVKIFPFQVYKYLPAPKKRFKRDADFFWGGKGIGSCWKVCLFFFKSGVRVCAVDPLVFSLFLLAL